MHKYQFEVFTSPCEVIIYDTPKTKADTYASSILKSAKHLEQKYNFFDERSYLSSLNSRKESTLDLQTKEVLKEARELCRLTDGVFDISVGTLKKNFHEELKHFVGIENWEIKKDKLIFTNPHTKLDLGGVIKEYAVDRAALYLRKSKVSSALINFGGDLYALGTKPDGSTFEALETYKMSHIDNYIGCPMVIGRHKDMTYNAFNTALKTIRTKFEGDSYPYYRIPTMMFPMMAEFMNFGKPVCSELSIFSLELAGMSNIDRHWGYTPENLLSTMRRLDEIEIVHDAVWEGV